MRLQLNHRVLEFKQEASLKLYIERNTKLQRETEEKSKKSKKQKAERKNNAIFIKRKSSEPGCCKNCDHVTTKKQHLQCSFRPAFKGEKQFYNRAVTIEKEKFRINLAKLIFIGASILDLNKI